MIKYVCGFLFHPSLDTVALILKNKPAWQKGKFNGIGGKIEPGETPKEAMEREFKEEAGVVIDKSLWFPLCQVGDDTYTVDFLYAVSGAISEVKTMEEEKVITMAINDMHNWKLIDNLHWLIPLCIDKMTGYSGKIILE